MGRGGPYLYCLRCGTNVGVHLRGGLCDWCAVVESVPYMEPEEGQKPPIPPTWWPWN
ncbi:MAG: hypothetical protein HY685_01500 [Chloroflexi bacterium]|nr:hypothetical protein [Chloroflexota bacterium]